MRTLSLFFIFIFMYRHKERERDCRQCYYLVGWRRGEMRGGEIVHRKRVGGGRHEKRKCLDRHYFLPERPYKYSSAITCVCVVSENNRYSFIYFSPFIFVSHLFFFSILILGLSKFRQWCDFTLFVDINNLKRKERYDSASFASDPRFISSKKV